MEENDVLAHARALYDAAAARGVAGLTAPGREAIREGPQADHRCPARSPGSGHADEHRLALLRSRMRAEAGAGRLASRGRGTVRPRPAPRGRGGVGQSTRAALPTLTLSSADRGEGKRSVL